jgi:quercetin dioxygenase-like cupin family protein
MATITRRLHGQLLRFSIEEEAFRLARSHALASRGRSARTLVKDGALRVTLVALSPGQSIPPHHAAGPITLQPVHGGIRVEVDREQVELEPTDLLALGAGVEHAVSSARGAVFLLTVVDPEEA